MHRENMRSTSDPSVYYEMLFTDDWEWYCSCAGFWYSNTCRHVKDAISDHEAGVPPRCEHYWTDVKTGENTREGTCSKCGIHMRITTEITDKNEKINHLELWGE